MKMCLKLAYCALSSSPSIDATKCTFWGFSSLFVEVETFWGVFSLPKLDCCKSLCEVASVCVFIHWIKMSLKLSLALFFSAFFFLVFLMNPVTSLIICLFAETWTFLKSLGNPQSLLLVLVNSSLLIFSTIISYSNSIAYRRVETMSSTWWFQACQTMKWMHSKW